MGHSPLRKDSFRGDWHLGPDALFPDALFIDESKINGKGVFSKSAIPAGAFVYTMEGETITMVELFLRVFRGKIRTLDDGLQIDHNKYLDVNTFSRTFNHSCNPNCGIKNGVHLYSLRDIDENEELTFDYSTTVSAWDFWWRMPCRCGSTQCRKILKPANRLPPATLDFYKARGVLPPFALVSKRINILPLVFLLTHKPLHALFWPLRVLSRLKKRAQ